MFHIASVAAITPGCKIMNDTSKRAVPLSMSAIGHEDFESEPS
jgi:hypothetical protein